MSFLVCRTSDNVLKNNSRVRPEAVLETMFDCSTSLFTGELLVEEFAGNCSSSFCIASIGRDNVSHSVSSADTGSSIKIRN